MSLGNVARVMVVLVAGMAAAGSATSNSSNSTPGNSGPPPQDQAMNQPPPPQQMDPSASIGLWRSTFGAVKIEADNSKGGLQTGAIQGVWVYQRQGEEVVGYFSGNLRGNVLDLRWQEPNNPPLTGGGWLVFDPQGRQFAGRWWSDRRDRLGDWNGWRQAPAQQQTANPFGGQSYGGTSDATPPPDSPSPYSQPPQPNTQPAPPPPRGYY